MRLEPAVVPAWPALAWAARFAQGSQTVTVQHGPMVEVAQDWIAEAVWDGDFGRGDFDLTNLVYGTGVRVRGDGVSVIGSGTGVDRLWFCQEGQFWYASNSLPCLMAVAGFELLDDYLGYADDLVTVDSKGIFSYTRTIPARPSAISVAYYQDLLWDGRSLQRRQNQGPADVW